MQNSSLNQLRHCHGNSHRGILHGWSGIPRMGLIPRAQRLMRRKTYCCSSCSWSLQYHLQIWTLGTVSATYANRSKFFRVSFGLLMCNTLLIILLLPEFNKHHLKQAQKLNNGKPWLIMALGLLLSFSLKILVLFVTLWSGTRGALLFLNEKIYQSTVEIYDLLNYGARPTEDEIKDLK